MSRSYEGRLTNYDAPPVSDLAPWLLEQIDEDRRGRLEYHTLYCGAVRWQQRDGWSREQDCDCGHPKQILAECDAKRRIIEEHRTVSFSDSDVGVVDVQVCAVCHAHMDAPVDDDGNDLDDGWQYPLVQYPAPCKTLRLLALPFADRVGYLEEWRP